ncbi:Uma2 family endonuclease [Nonomuraea fuscirosea]|uniref:Uma2 family endonuclease n=1 Tax=Nonomuraea fuscirosea TaxID=1291556 RepID=UPI002DDBF3A8|nr:Uma2 family endonuclease [Nonomuraea fuscirosea]WSA54364.1 Uma2 family endonuclease [Nonomuraea fuscirosea]
MMIESPATQPEESSEHMPQTSENTPGTARELFDALPPLPGFRVEVIEGKLIVSPLGSPEHHWSSADLHDAFYPLRKERGWVGSPQGPGICIEGPRDSLSPDYVLTHEKCERWGNELLSSGVLLVAEVVSPSSVYADREEKLRLYALGKIPVYLLIDPIAQSPTVTVYSDVSNGKYRLALTESMGKVVMLPTPINFELDTSMIRV